MKLGVAYNFFNGEELLYQSVSKIRETVDFIVVLFQKISNSGNEVSQEAFIEVLKLKKEKLIDEICFYNPDLKLDPHLNEMNKRQLGFKLCKERLCTHFLCMDADEFYLRDQFIYAKNKIESMHIDSGVCHIQDYSKDPEFKFKNIASYCVPFIYSVFNNRKYVLRGGFPHWVDPTRIMNPVGSCLKFEPNEILMHHFPLTRRDITSKYENSSSKKDFKNIQSMIEYHKNWNGRDFDNYLGTSVEKCKNLINIKI
jgi:hypothetical protein